MCGVPKRPEALVEQPPHRLGGLQDPMAIAVALARALLVTALREERKVEVPDQRADVETHRAVERELGIDGKGLGVRYHDRAGMKVAVDHRLGVAQEFELQLLRRAL